MQGSRTASPCRGRLRLPAASHAELSRPPKALRARMSTSRGNGKSFPVEFSLMPMVEEGEPVGSVSASATISQPVRARPHEGMSSSRRQPRAAHAADVDPPARLAFFPQACWVRSARRATSLLRHAVANSDRLVRLINDILDLEENDLRPALPLAFRRIALEELVRRHRGHAAHAEAEDVHLASDPIVRLHRGGFGPALQVMTKPAQQRHQVLSAPFPVRISTARATDGVTVSVVDEGRGVPADKLESIFDPLPAGRCFGFAAERRYRPRSGDLPHHRPSAWRAASGQSKTKAEAPSSGSSCPSALPFPR